LQGVAALAGRGVPDADAAVGAAAGEPAAVRAERRRLENGRLLQLGKELSCLRVPEAEHGGPAGGREPPAVRADGEAHAHVRARRGRGGGGPAPTSRRPGRGRWCPSRPSTAAYLVGPRPAPARGRCVPPACRGAAPPRRPTGG